jgi:hypothetical protein
MNEPSTGQCLCGSIKYEVDEIGPKVGHCHCSMCRKFHGAAFATLGEAKAADFRWVAGEEQLISFTAGNGTTRQFCGKCGSSMTFAPSNDSGKVVEFALGTLDSEISRQPDAHIFVGSKASWYDIHDSLPRFDCGRNSDLVDQ